MEPNNDFIMLPTNDFCFTELMGNPKVRKGFIAALLHLPPEQISDTKLLPTLLEREYEDDKLGILDVHVILCDGSHMNIEMQVRYYKYWDDRALFYLCKMFDGQLKRGIHYTNLQKCIQVSILSFNRFTDDDICYRTIHLHDESTGNIYTDKLEMQILELKKLPKELNSGEDIVTWMRFFNGKNREELESMAKSNEYLEEAYNQLVKLSADDRKRLQYEQREKAIRDYNSYMAAAHEDGLEQGIQLTRRVFQLHLQGKTPSEIAQECNLSIEKIQEILG